MSEQRSPAGRDRPAVPGPGRGPTAALDASRTGDRVTVRRRLPPGGGAGATDVVGTLVAADEHRLVVRSRDGADTPIPRHDVVVARVVPEPSTRLRRAADIDPAVLEQVAARGWQPSEADRLGGWTLRAAGGFTGRANSVLPLGDPGLPLDDALARVVAWYEARGLRARFQVPLPWAQALDAELEQRGWELTARVQVMVADVPAALAALGVPAPGHAADVSVTVTSRPDDAWLTTYRYRGEPLWPAVVAVVERAENPRFVTVRDAEGPVAVGRGALDSGWFGITAVDVVEHVRRRGYGRLVLRTLLAEARRGAVRFAYLQVADDNAAALALYRSAGFTRHHDYVYRAAPGTGPVR